MKTSWWKKPSSRCWHNSTRTPPMQRLSPAKLAAAKRQFMGQIEVSTDHSENVALALGKSFLRYGRFDSLEEIASLMEQITADDILEVANELLSEDRLSMLIYE